MQYERQGQSFGAYCLEDPLLIQHRDCTLEERDCDMHRNTDFLHNRIKDLSLPIGDPQWMDPTLRGIGQCQIPSWGQKLLLPAAL
jgi:hypothetical protein